MTTNNLERQHAGSRPDGTGRRRASVQFLSSRYELHPDNQRILNNAMVAYGLTFRGIAPSASFIPARLR
jgi:hypothetical protein